MDGLDIRKTVMRNIKLLLLLLIIAGCSKEEDDVVIVDPPDPPVLCEIDYTTLQSGINKITSHYQPMNKPFVDFAGLINANLNNFGSFTVWYAHADFNNNDISDLVLAPSNWETPSQNEIVIVKDGIITHAFKNPQVFTRKIAIEDLNQDGIDDIILFGTGPDIADSPGDKTTVIYVYANTYKVSEIGLKSGYYHTGAVGTLVGGLSDIIEINSQAFASDKDGFVKFYSNNGISELWVEGETNITNHHVATTYQSELYDFDNDGVLDLILGGHEFEKSWMSDSYKPVQWRTHILRGLGNGQFDIDNPSLLPIVPDWGVITDFDMYDIDNDGLTEIMVTRTTGNNNDNGLPIDGEYYDGILIQILKQSNGSWYEWKKLEQPQAVNNYHIVWATTTMVYDVNGDCLLDIIPESDKINAASFSFDAIRGFYYEQQTNGDFNIKFKT